MVTSAAPYNDITGKLDDLPEINKKQVHTNVACLDSGKLNNVPAGEVNIEYIMLYNKMKTTPDILAPKISSVITNLMEKYSSWVLIKNILARVFYFANAKLSFQAAQKKAERTIFLQFQNAA